MAGGRVVKVEVLHTADCPNWRSAGDELRAALDATGLTTISIGFIEIESFEQAVRLSYAGSPTILIDGADLFPLEERAADMSCRVYETSAGLRGRPERSQIERALRNRG